MHRDFHLDVERIRVNGFRIGVGKRLSRGRILHLKGHEQIADGLSDLPTLAQYTEVEIAGINGAPSLFILTSCLLLFPQVFLGFHLSGCPTLLGVTKAMAGHVLILGPTQSGKSTTLASVVFQLSRLGYFVAGVSLKDTDAVLVGSMKAGADSLTRLDKEGNRHPVPLRFFSLKAGEFTEGCNLIVQRRHEQPVWMQVAEMLLALGLGGMDKDAARNYFSVSAQALLQDVQEWGGSFRELRQKIDTLKLDRDTLYSTAGLRHAIAQQAAIEQANLPDGHPFNINFGDLIQQRGVFYGSACYQDAGGVASATAALLIKAIIAAKREVCPDRTRRIFVFIDEAQLFPQALLKQIIEQAASNGVTLIIVQHNLDQFGEEWESLSMTQVRILFGAVAGASTDLHLQRLFGTKRDYLFGFNRCGGTSTTQTFTESEGPTGTSVSLANGSATSRQAGCSLTERETPVWGPNETLALNYDRDRFVIQVSPGAEFSFFGDKAILCQRGGIHLNFDEINRLTGRVLADTTNKFLPGAAKPKLLNAPKLSPELQAKRSAWLAAFEKTAARVREAIG